MSFAIELSRAFGMLHEEEVVFLKEIMEKLPENPKVINFGAGFGTSALAMVETRSDAKVISIDLRDDNNPFGGLMNERNAFEETGLELPEQIKGCSYEIGFKFQKKRSKYDLVFVDGDHSAEGLTKDIEAWKPLVKKHGYMLFHDYERDVWPAVAPVVDEMMADWTEVGLADTLKAYINE